MKKNNKNGSEAVYLFSSENSKQYFPPRLIIPDIGTGYLAKRSRSEKYLGKVAFLLRSPELARQFVIENALDQDVNVRDALDEYEKAIQGLLRKHEALLKAEGDGSISPDASNRVLEDFEACKRRVISLIYPEIDLNSVSLLDF